MPLTPSSIAYDILQPLRRHALLSRALQSRTCRLGILSASITVLLLIALTRYPTRFRSESIEQDTNFHAYRGSEPKSYDDNSDPPNWKYREEAVKDAFLHAYRAYEDHAFPADELWPLSDKPRQNFNGWGVSVVDAMDTMILMDLKPEFKRALVHVSTMTFDLPEGQFAHFFETTIRYLGGLLSAHALSNESILLKKADELGHKLLAIFDTPSGLPTFSINTESGEKHEGDNKPRVLLAEIASCQLEYRYLAHLTGKAEYYWAVDRINYLLQISQNSRNNSLWSTHWETINGTQVDEHFSIGAGADSAVRIVKLFLAVVVQLMVNRGKYEYVLKQYLQTSKTENRFKTMYLRAIRGIIDRLLYLSPTRQLLYVTDTWGPHPSRKFEHLSCFFPGLLALGVQSLASDASVPERDMLLQRWAAEGLAHTCWTMYGESPSGLGPDIARFHSAYLTGVPMTKVFTERWMSHVRIWEAEGSPGGKPPGVANLAELVKKKPGVERDYVNQTPSYLLRPETIESIYLMWKTTGDEVWRERGWAVFKAIERHCRLHVGYASILNVNEHNPNTITNKLDDMPSYALAETWKYLFLLFSSKDLLPLDQWVFNTEAHPLPVFEWYEAEKKDYRIE